MKWMLLSILVVAPLSGGATTAKSQEKGDLQTYCPVPEWPSDLTKPKVVKYEAPPPAEQYGVTRACLTVQIDEAGNVTEVQVVRSDSPDFGSSSAAAVRQWQLNLRGGARRQSP